MTNTLLQLFNYLKNPVLETDSTTNFKYRLKTFFKLLIISVLTGFLLSPFIAILGEMGFVDLDSHKVDTFFKDMPLYKILLIGAVSIPVIEELIFRGPMTLFTNKKTFKIAFYLLTIIFGFIHITNFEINTNTLLFSPLLILPQLVVGFYFGFIRVRFGLIWSIFLHGTYNGLLISISYLS